MSLPEYPQSFWLSTAEMPSFGRLDEDKETEIVVIGGGIVGITTAYLLAMEGKKVILATAAKLVSGTTGYTTAKVTAQHDLIYDELIQNFGEIRAGLYYEANRDGLAFIKDMVGKYGIECDFAEEDAYIYATDVSKVEAIKREHAAYERLGIEGSLSNECPLPYPVAIALSMKNQARFHPVPYLARLIREFVQAGGIVFEDTPVEKVHDEEEEQVVVTEDGRKIRCKTIVSCSQFPFPDNGFFFARLLADSSYAIAVRPVKDVPSGMYISADSAKRSVRSVEYGGEKLLILGGESHKTGQGICTFKHYEELERFARTHFETEDILYRWSSLDYSTLDKIPYIGRVSHGHPNRFVAAGFRKWGMTTSAVAAQLIRDLILGVSNRYEELFAPSRFQADPDVGTLVSHAGEVGKLFIGGKLEWITRTPDDLLADQGSLVRLRGHKAGAYRDHDGALHLVDTTCTHMGCEVEWNNGDRTWDCPCHGSRYSYDGEVIKGPAKKALKRLTELQPEEPNETGSGMV